MLTEDETRLVAHAYALRHDEPGVELWFCPADNLFAEAARLSEGDYLNRRWNADDLVYRLTDQAMAAQELSRLLGAQSPN
jgi:hypothetical protein